MYQTLKVSVADRIATVTLDRPERRNAMSVQMREDLLRCAGDIAPLRDVDVVIVTGAGQQFSAGADLHEAFPSDTASVAEQRELASLGYRLTQAWEATPQITIAAIEGCAVGGGLALALSLDWRIMAHNAFLSLPEVSMGFAMGWGTLPRLVNLIGPAKAKRIAILGERFAAADALALGLADEVCESGTSYQRAQAMAQLVCEKPSHAVRMTKEAVNAYANIGAHATSYMAHDQFAFLVSTPGVKEARKAALKRP